jgi:AcrR family transcriptional regulator
MVALTRQQKADDTRRRLFLAALHLFTQAGYHATTVEAIAARAGVAKGTFFVHFPTKDAVILELVRIQTRAAIAARTAALSAGPLSALRAATLELGDQAGLSRPLSRAVLGATLTSSELADAADAEFQKVLAAMLDDANAALARRPAAADKLARGLMAAYLGAALHFATNAGSPPMRELLEPLVDQLLEPFAPSRGGTNAPRARRRSAARKRM